jgi:hypothetical protein
MNLKKRIFFITVFNLVSLLIIANNDDIQYEFSQTDSSYTFTSIFKINANKECLIHVFFDFEHIKALAPSAENVKLIKSGSNWNKISYTYKAFIFSNTSVWSRKINQKASKVNFELVSSTNNNSLMPEMTSSSGYYQITSTNDGLEVRYYQECTLTKSIFTNLYIDKVKSEAVEFMYWLKKYAVSECQD